MLALLEGKKTYTALAAAAVSWGISVALRHGIDLGPISSDLTEILTFAMLAVAAWARSATSRRESRRDKLSG